MNLSSDVMHKEGLVKLIIIDNLTWTNIENVIFITLQLK